MGHNLDLIKMLGIKNKQICPNCKNLVLQYFDEYDIDCGEPNPLNGIWELSCNCDICQHEWKYKFMLTIRPFKDKEKNEN
jgi:hypothetical protein